VATYYLDTSALVKRYAMEAGTAWVTALINPGAGHTLYTVRLAGPELVAALGRKARTGELTSAQATSAIAAFRRAWTRRYRIVAATVAVTEHAMDLAERRGLRGYDAVHLAAALEIADARQRRSLGPPTFVSADSDQRQAAATEGLPTADPAAYP
jgi:predicted nucleic acid-binding protein